MTSSWRRASSIGWPKCSGLGSDPAQRRSPRELSATRLHRDRQPLLARLRHHDAIIPASTDHDRPARAGCDAPPYPATSSDQAGPSPVTAADEKLILPIAVYEPWEGLQPWRVPVQHRVRPICLLAGAARLRIRDPQPRPVSGVQFLQQSGRDQERYQLDTAASRRCVRYRVRALLHQHDDRHVRGLIDLATRLRLSGTARGFRPDAGLVGAWALAPIWCCRYSGRPACATAPAPASTRFWGQ